MQSIELDITQRWDERDVIASAATLNARSQAAGVRPRLRFSPFI
jgi:hypothetical protein